MQGRGGQTTAAHVFSPCGLACGWLRARLARTPSLGESEGSTSRLRLSAGARALDPVLPITWCWAGGLRSGDTVRCGPGTGRCSPRGTPVWSRLPQWPYLR